MPVLTNQRHRLRQIDLQLLDLLEERARIADEIDPDMDEDTEVEDTDELVLWWQEEGAERGFEDEPSLERACRAIEKLTR